MPRRLEPLTKANATGNGVPSTEDLIRTSNVLLGAVQQLREDVGRRLDDIAGRLDGVCTEVVEIKQGRQIEAAVEAAVAAERKEQAAERKSQSQAAAQHVLTLWQRAGIAAGALCGIGTLVLKLAGH